MSGIGALNTFNTSPSADFKTEFMNSSTNTKVSDADNDYEMSVWLYADPAFDLWVAKVEDSTNSPTENEKEFADQYSPYTLAIFCDITKVAGSDQTANRAESGCCLRDETQKGGGYCMKLSSTQKEVVTVFLTDANFETVLATPYDLTSIAAPQKSQIGITIFYVPTSQQNAASNDSLNSWTGYKSQPWPAASWTEMYRFEKDDKATGLIYNAPATGASKWLDESKTLKGAFNALTGATLLSLVAGICAISF